MKSLTPVPAERLAALRILTGLFAFVYVTARLPYFADLSRFDASHFEPVGLVSLLSSPLPPAFTWALAVATSLCGLAFCFGWRFKVMGPIFAALFLWVTTYRSSWGMVYHTENLVALHLGALALCGDAADVWALDARGRPTPSPAARYAWPVLLLSALTVCTYLLAGVAKLRLGGMEWITEGVLGHTISYDAIRKTELGSVYSPLGIWLASAPWLFVPLSALTMAVEVFAPVALLKGRIGRWWALTAWGFHIGVLATMAIFFPYVTLMIGFASFFEAERPFEWALARRRERRRGAGGPEGPEEAPPD